MLRSRHGVFVFAAQRQPLVLGGGERAGGGGALLSEGRDLRRITVVELGVGQCRVDRGDPFRQCGNCLIEFIDAPPERGEFAAFFRRGAAQIGAGGPRFGGAVALLG